MTFFKKTGDISFRTEDCLLTSIGFHLQEYKKERLLEHLLKDRYKEEIKKEAALQMIPDNTQ